MSYMGTDATASAFKSTGALGGQQRFDRYGVPIIKKSQQLPSLTKAGSEMPPKMDMLKTSSGGSPKKEKDKTKFKVTFIDKIDKT